MGGRRRRTGRGSYLLCHLSHGLDAGSIQVAVVLAGLDKLVGLNVLLHFLPGRHKVVIPAIYLVLPLGPRRICQEVTPPPKDLTTIPPASTLPTVTPQRAQLVLRGRGLLGRPRPGETGGAAPPASLGHPSPRPGMVPVDVSVAEQHPCLRTPVFRSGSACDPWAPPPTPTAPQGPALTGNTGSELVGELGEEIIVGAVLGGPEDNDGASIVH